MPERTEGSDSPTRFSAGVAFLRRWPYTFGALVSIAIGIWAVVTAWLVDIPLLDPEGFLGPAYVRLPLMAAAFFAADILPRAIRYDAPGHYFKRCTAVVREQWTLARAGNVTAGLLVFYVTYVAYRNLKSVLPAVRQNLDYIDDEVQGALLYDHFLLRLDYFIFFGNHPFDLLHSLLSTQPWMAHFLSFIYVAYLPLIPISLAAMLVWNRDTSLGAWYATALSLNWVFGTISYYMVPSLGPAYYQPSFFSELPVSGVTELQASLFRNRVHFLESPESMEHVQGIAGFASLHTSVVFAACLFFHRIGAHWMLRYFLWFFFITTITATSYFGWHYVSDVAAGMFIGWLSVALGAWASGNKGVHVLRQRRQEKAPPETERDLAEERE